MVMPVADEGPKYLLKPSFLCADKSKERHFKTCTDVHLSRRQKRENNTQIHQTHGHSCKGRESREKTNKEGVMCVYLFPPKPTNNISKRKNVTARFKFRHFFLNERIDDILTQGNLLRGNTPDWLGRRRRRRPYGPKITNTNAHTYVTPSAVESSDIVPHDVLRHANRLL